jgi:hypothetical protein
MCSCLSGRCSGCCRCSTRGVEFRPGKFQLFTSTFSKGEFKGNPIRRHISVELEVDSFNRESLSSRLNLALDKWQDAVVSDGSIPGGFEINTNPTNGDLFMAHLKELCDGLSDISGRCSNACGLHVHVNCKGSPLFDRAGKAVLDKDGMQKFDKQDAFTGYDLRRLVELYVKVEPAMFDLVHPRRISGRYSVPCGAYYLAKDSLEPKKFRKSMVSKMYRNGADLNATPPPESADQRAQRELRDLRRGTRTPVVSNHREVGSAIKRAKTHKYESVRYKALNLHSFFMRGTVEFRHHEGSVDFKDVTNWALTCATVVDMAAKMSHSEINSLPTVSREALMQILPSDLQKYAQERWEKHEREIPRYRETVSDAWRGLGINR